jgi:hypothetical protein
LLLSIDEFPNVYDGTNQHVRNSFATMIYHRHYKAPNGRGYIILKPIQKEMKEFYPNLLGTLPKITINLTKPNGDLFNQSSDEYKIFKVDYEALNPHFLKIVTNIYFDKNEFYVGDVCTFTGYQALLSPITQGIRDLNLFINRPSTNNVGLFGNAQVAPKLKPPHNKFIFAAPSFLVFSIRTYNELGRPSFNTTHRSDCAGELSHIATEKGILINLLLPNHAEIINFDLDENHTFGYGTTYGNNTYHAFESRFGKKDVFFINKCNSILNG